MAVLFITHDFGVVADIADRVAVMEKGHVVEQGSVADVLERPHHPYTRRLLAAVPTLNPPVRPAVGDAPVACAATGLAKTYRGNDWFSAQAEVAAVKDVSFEIRRGETLGLVGESGSGKSTIGRLVMRLTDGDTGIVRIGELDFTQSRGAGLRDARKHIQMVFQDPFTSLNPRRRVGRIIADGPIAHGVRQHRPSRVPRNCWRWLASIRARHSASRMNSPAGNGSGLVLRVRWRSIPTCWWRMSRCRRSTSRSRPRCSRCSRL